MYLENYIRCASYLGYEDLDHKQM
jgi:hypothetical protein